MQRRVCTQDWANGGLDLGSGCLTGSGALGASTAAGGDMTVDGAGALSVEAGAVLPVETSQQDMGAGAVVIVCGEADMPKAGQQECASGAGILAHRDHPARGRATIAITSSTATYWLRRTIGWKHARAIRPKPL